jgi:hypothetical protein
MKTTPIRPTALENIERVTLTGLGEALAHAIDTTTRDEDSGVRRIPAHVVAMRALVRDGGMRL